MLQKIKIPFSVLAQAPIRPLQTDSSNYYFSLRTHIKKYTLIPPFIGFFSKLFVLFSAISISKYFLVIIAIIVSVISAYYYLRIIKVLYTEDNNKNILILEENTEAFGYNATASGEGIKSFLACGAEHILTNLHSLVIAVLSLFLVLFFINPGLILTSTRVLSLSLFNY